MAFTTEVFEFQGDTTQALRNFVWKSKQFVFDNRLSHIYAAVLFDQGDLEDYQAAVDTWEDIVRQNRQIISTGAIFPDGIDIDGVGFDIAAAPITGTNLTDPGVFPVYSGDLELTLRAYVDGVLRFTKDLLNQKPFRINSRRRGRRWSFEITGNVTRVLRMDFASSMDELKTLIQEGD